MRLFLTFANLFSPVSVILHMVQDILTAIMTVEFAFGAVTGYAFNQLVGSLAGAFEKRASDEISDSDSGHDEYSNGNSGE